MYIPWKKLTSNLTIKETCFFLHNQNKKDYLYYFYLKKYMLLKKYSDAQNKINDIAPHIDKASENAIFVLLLLGDSMKWLFRY